MFGPNRMRRHKFCKSSTKPAVYLQTKKQGDWAQIKLSDKVSGWVNARFLTETSAPAPKPKTCSCAAACDHATTGFIAESCDHATASFFAESSSTASANANPGDDAAAIDDTDSWSVGSTCTVNNTCCPGCSAILIYAKQRTSLRHDYAVGRLCNI